MSVPLLDLSLVLLTLVSVSLAGFGRLQTLISATAAQGLLLGVLTLQTRELSVHSAVLAAAGMLLKGVVFPKMLLSAIRETRLRREVEPYISYSMSVVVSAAAFGSSLWLAARLPFALSGAALAPSAVALHMVFTGFLLITARKNAITQALGYLVLENGIYAFGILLPSETPVAVELGLLLDVFVAVFVMGIIVFQINREFEHLDIEKMSALREDGDED